VIARAARGVRRRAQMAAHRGDAVHCPVCGRDFDRFRDAWNRPWALCWRCGAHERHRSFALLLDERPHLVRGREVLHFAPEWCLERRLRALAPARYVTADLEPGAADLALDLQALALPDAAFETVICSHVLEHVPDDGAAMGELHRVTRPDGISLVMVPTDLGRESTYEDPAIDTPAAREAAYWQHDHLRLYSRDVGERLANAGFEVERWNAVERVGGEEAVRLGLLVADDIWVCRRPPTASGRQ